MTIVLVVSFLEKIRKNPNKTKITALKVRGSNNNLLFPVKQEDLSVRILKCNVYFF